MTSEKREGQAPVSPGNSCPTLAAPTAVSRHGQTNPALRDAIATITTPVQP